MDGRMLHIWAGAYVAQRALLYVWIRWWRVGKPLVDLHTEQSTHKRACRQAIAGSRIFHLDQ